MLLVTDTVLSVWRELGDLPFWARLAYFTLLGVLSLAVAVLAWRFLRPRTPEPVRGEAEPVTSEALESELLTSAQAGVDIQEALGELEEQRRRKSSGEVHLAIFGEVSTGKSSLVRSLVPGAAVETDPRGGTCLLYTSDAADE